MPDLSNEERPERRSDPSGGKAGALKFVVLSLIVVLIGFAVLIKPQPPAEPVSSPLPAVPPVVSETKESGPPGAVAKADDERWSVARRWNERTLDAIRRDYPAPTVHARNLFHVSLAMYDAWAAYDETATGYLVREKLAASDIQLAREQAISYAVYRILSARYAGSPGVAESQASFDALMSQLGLDPLTTATVGNTASALGNRIAQAVLSRGQSDGANESNLYVGDTGYKAVNPPMVVMLPGTTLVDKNRWQPLVIENMRLQNGLPAPDNTQRFLGSHWGYVTPFALRRTDSAAIYNDPGAPPLLGGKGDAEFKRAIVDVIRYSSWLDPRDGATIDISPGATGNNTVGNNDGRGYAVNPYTGKPYEPNTVKRGDYGRIIAEFWADGPFSETPPGHWNTLANYVSDHPRVTKSIGGNGPVLDNLEWDVKLYFALNGALHDAAIAAWDIKAKYDYVRPISAIRYMGGLGQSSAPALRSYHADGLPLVPGLVELITRETTQPGGRHRNMEGHEGEIAIYAWPGQPRDTENEFSGVKWKRAVAWVPYQRDNFVTPPFAGYVSGHSTFSRAGAEVMTAFTGSKYFPGGLGEKIVPKDRFLHFEIGPTEDIVLQWATYYDAADEAGISRLWGGIHVAADDRHGRIIGARVGKDAWALAQRYYSGAGDAVDDSGANLVRR